MTKANNKTKVWFITGSSRGLGRSLTEAVLAGGDQVAATASGCVLVPLDLPGIGLRALMDEINHRHLPLAVIVIGRDSELAIAVELVRFGAFDFLEHPFTDRRLRSVIRRAIGAVSE